MIVCVITAAINIITNYILIPIWGPIGAAATTAFCSLCILIMLLFKIDKNIRFERVHKLIISPVIGCLFVAVFCFAMWRIDSNAFRIILSICGSVLIYGIIQILLKNEMIIEAVTILRNRLKR